MVTVNKYTPRNARFVAIFGQRNSAKTTTLRHYLDAVHHDVVVVCSPLPEIARTAFPNAVVVSTVKQFEACVRVVLNRQAATGQKASVAVVVDDHFELYRSKSTMLKEIVINGGHYNIAVYLSASCRSYIRELAPQADVTHLCHTDSVDTIDTYFKFYSSVVWKSDMLVTDAKRLWSELFHKVTGVSYRQLVFTPGSGGVFHYTPSVVADAGAIVHPMFAYAMELGEAVHRVVAAHSDTQRTDDDCPITYTADQLIAVQRKAAQHLETAALDAGARHGGAKRRGVSSVTILE
jgi:hypothetical protein